MRAARPLICGQRRVHQPQFEPKLAAHAHRTVRADGAAHQLEGPAMHRTCSPNIRFCAHIATIEQYSPEKLTIQRPSALLK